MKNVLVIVLLFMGINTSFAENTPDTHYYVAPKNAFTAQFDLPYKVTVVEFFSTGCPACTKLNPALEKWLLDKPAYVQFEKIPVVFAPGWDKLAREYVMSTHKNNNPQAIDSILENNQKIVKAFVVFQAPEFLIDGKYKVNPSTTGSSPEYLMQIVNEMVIKEAKHKHLV